MNLYKHETGRCKKMRKMLFKELRYVKKTKNKKKLKSKYNIGNNNKEGENELHR